MRKFLLLFFVLLSAGSINPEYDMVVVRSDLPFDWIIAQAYSQSSGVPIITTSSQHLDEDVKQQLRVYNSSIFNSIVIIGGEQAISQDVKSELDRMGFITHRISEGDRYGTSATTAIELFITSKTAVIVNGEVYDGLFTAERIAAVAKIPILFVRSDEIPPSVLRALERLGVRKILLVDSGISEKVQEELNNKGYSIETVGRNSDVRRLERGSRDYLYMLAGLVLGIFASFVFFKLKKYSERVPYTILTEDEEKVVRFIVENGGEISQDKLPAKTDFSRPKISRIIKGLVDRDILIKKPYGRTQKLTVKKDFYEKRSK